MTTGAHAPNEIEMNQENDWRQTECKIRAKNAVKEFDRKKIGNEDDEIRIKIKQDNEKELKGRRLKIKVRQVCALVQV